jgi:membrane associated rhomboid family serine protease
MLFPIGDDQVKGGQFPIFSYVFIAINIAVFFFLQIPSEVFTYSYSTVPYEITKGVDLVGNIQGVPHYPGPTPIYSTLFTSMFMHGGWMHLIGNMLFLWIFADNIESTVGRKRFLLFYLLAGLTAALAHVFSAPNSIIPSLEASGAIAGCLGCYLVMFPKSKIKMLFIIKIFSVPAFLFLLFWIGQQFFNVYVASQNPIQESGVAWFAHIGGFLFGVLSGIYFRFYYPKMKHINQQYIPVNRNANRYNNRQITNHFKNYSD